MHFDIPGSNLEFEIPDEWWSFAGMNTFSPNGGGYFPHVRAPGGQEKIQIMRIVEIEPPLRTERWRAAFQEI